MFSFSLKENYKSKDYSNFIEFKNDMGLCFGRNKFFDPAEEKIIISNLNEGKIQYQNTIFKNIKIILSQYEEILNKWIDLSGC